MTDPKVKFTELPALLGTAAIDVLLAAVNSGASEKVTAKQLPFGREYANTTALKAATGYTIGDYASAWRGGVLTQVQLKADTGQADGYGYLQGVGGVWEIQPLAGGSVVPEMFGAAMGDLLTDYSAEVQAFVNYLSNNFLKGKLNGFYRADKIYFHYDAVNNAGYQPDESLRGRYSIEGVSVASKSNLKNGDLIGAGFYSEAVSGTPFIAEPTGDDATVFPNRGFCLKKITFVGNTPDWLVKLDGVNSPRYESLRALNTHDDGSGLLIRDNDQAYVRDIRCVGSETYNAGTVGFRFDNIDIDSSGNDVRDVLSERFEIANMIGATPLSGDFIVSSLFALFRSNDCDIGSVIQDRINGTTFMDFQNRGKTHGSKIHGRQKSNTYINHNSGASLDGGVAAVADLEIGDPSGSAAANELSSVKFIGATFPSVYAVGVAWKGQSGITDVVFESPRFFGAEASAELFNFNGNPQGGRIIDPVFDGTYASEYAGTEHYGQLTEFKDEVSGNQVTGVSTLHGDGGNTASATTVDLPVALTHAITGTTDIDSFTIKGGNPPAGTVVHLKFSGTTNVLSTVGGGTGTGNIKILSGDFAASADAILELTFIGGSFRAA